MEIDLDINNYTLNDILNLFKMPLNFDGNDMKRAKQIVLKTHPDKSRLDKQYFLFYSKAFKLLYSVWEFRKKGDVDKTDVNTDYSLPNEDEQIVLLNNFFKSNKEMYTNKSNFNKWFNEQFEKNNISSEGDKTGYGDWLKSNDGIDAPLKNMTMSAMGERIEEKKMQMRALVLHNDIQDICDSNSGCELLNTIPTNFDSGLFSNLQYQDLQKAHVEGVIPVTKEDYDKRQHFLNVNEYVSYRNNQNIVPLSEQKSQQYLNKKNNHEDELSVRRAYQLAKESEINKQKSEDFWKSLKLLGNK